VHTFYDTDTEYCTVTLANAMIASRFC